MRHKWWAAELQPHPLRPLCWDGLAGDPPPWHPPTNQPVRVLQDAVARHPPAIRLREIRYADKDRIDGGQETESAPLCHAGVLPGWDGEAYLYFHFFFMQRLPQTLRTQLGEVEPGDCMLSPPGPTSCGLSTKPQKVARTPPPMQRRLLRPASSCQER